MESDKRNLEVKKIMNVTVIQPKYFSGENPDEKIAKFIKKK